MDNKRNRDNSFIDNSNNNNNNINENNNSDYKIDNINQFKKLKYSATTKKQFQEIAKSLSVKINGRKDEVYRNIENYLEVKEKIESEKREKDSINPFNKEQPKLVIKSIDDNSGIYNISCGNSYTIERLELLFWKVFRNKYIFNSIFSNFKFKSCFSYERLFKCPEILNNYSNGLEILRDKIKSSSYITYETLHYLYSFLNKKSNQQQLKSTEISQLLNQLFTNYPDYFSDIDIELNRIVESSNIVVLEAFINKFNLNTHQINSINKIYRKNSIFHNGISNNKSLRFLTQLKLNYNFNFNNNNNCINHYSIFNRISSINKLIEIIKLLLNYSKEDFKVETNCNDNEFLERLSIDNSNSLNLSSSSSSSSSHSTEFNSLLKEIEEFKLTNDQLNTSYFGQIKITNYLNSDIIFNGQFKDRMNELKEILLKLFKLYFTIAGEQFNHSTKEILYDRYDLTSINTSSKYLFKYVYNNYQDMVYNNRISTEKNEFIFKLFEKLFNEKKNTIIFGSIVSLDDLELLEFINKRYNPVLQGVFENVHRMYIDENIITEIKSTKVLDFFFNYYNIIKNKTRSWLYLSSVELLEHYETLLSKIQCKFLVSCFFPPILVKQLFEDRKHPLIIFELLYRVLKVSGGSNNSVYQYESSFALEGFKYVFLKYLEFNRIDIIISIFKIFKFKSFKFYELFDIKKVYPFKLFHWVAINFKKSKISIDTITLTSTTTTSENSFEIIVSLQQYIHSLLYTNQFSEIINTLTHNDSNYYKRLFIDNKKYTTPNLPQFTNHILNYYFNTLESFSTSSTKPTSKENNQILNLKLIITSILLESSTLGYSSIFKLLLLEYSGLLKKNYIFNNKKLVLLNHSDLDTLINKSFISTNLEILEILQSFIKIKFTYNNKISYNFISKINK